MRSRGTRPACGATAGASASFAHRQGEGEAGLACGSGHERKCLDWSPSAAECDAAHETVLQSVTIGVTPAEAITSAFGQRGPKGHVMKACADFLSEPGVHTTREGQQLDRELHQVLYEVQRPPPTPLHPGTLRHRGPQDRPPFGLITYVEICS